MRVPNFLNADDINHASVKVEINGGWFVAKPMGFYGLCLRRRVYLAWCVFIGKYDVVFFEEDRIKMK